MIDPHPALVGRKLLLCASTGGHLWQLDRIARAFDVSDDSLWVTFDTDQTRSLLEGPTSRTGIRTPLSVPVGLVLIEDELGWDSARTWPVQPPAGPTSASQPRRVRGGGAEVSRALIHPWGPRYGPNG